MSLDKPLHSTLSLLVLLSCSLVCVFPFYSNSSPFRITLKWLMSFLVPTPHLSFSIHWSLLFINSDTDLFSFSFAPSVVPSRVKLLLFPRKAATEFSFLKNFFLFFPITSSAPSNLHSIITPPLFLTYKTQLTPKFLVSCLS